MGFSPEEGNLLLIRQFSEVNGALTLMGQPLPEHIDLAIRPQLLDRLISSAPEIDPLFRVGMNSDRRSATKASSWLREIAPERPHLNEFEIKLKDVPELRALPGAELMPQVRTLLQADHKRGVEPDQFRSRILKRLLETGVAETKGEMLRPSIEMLFSVEMAGDAQIARQAQRIRNQARFEQYEYVDEAEPRLAHLLSSHAALVAQANST
ncbi:MAG TPA: hypothetical protein VMF31_08095 [Solirubrobacterales bacterium]|nr:hypothetical protein [Solirubrobacterales bacterium]